ncbi:MAG TPA: PTS sugar transporter subunit IIA [Acidiphilium sp.]
MSREDRLADLLDDAALCPGLNAYDAADAIRQLAARLEWLGRVRPDYARAVIAREAAMPTGLPLGAINVAIPHTDPEHVIAPAVAVATLAVPVDFASMDDPDEKLPVRVVFLLALTDKIRQLATLRSVCALIQDAGRLGRIAAVSDQAGLRAALSGEMLTSEIQGGTS